MKCQRGNDSGYKSFMLVFLYSILLSLFLHLYSLVKLVLINYEGWLSKERINFSPNLKFLLFLSFFINIYFASPGFFHSQVT